MKPTMKQTLLIMILALVTHLGTTISDAQKSDAELKALEARVESFANTPLPDVAPELFTSILLTAF